MPTKIKIIGLLKQIPNNKIAKLVLDRIDSMDEEDLNDLYFLLTTKNKKKIAQFSRKKARELHAQFFELAQIEADSKKVTNGYLERQCRKMDEIFATNLLNSS